MTDTVRTRGQLSSLLVITENSGITGQDVRDFLASSVLAVDKTPNFYEVRNSLFRKSSYLEDLKKGDYVRQLDNGHLYLLQSLPPETHDNWLDLGEVIIPIDTTGLTLLYVGTPDDGLLAENIWANTTLVFDEVEKYVYTSNPEDITQITTSPSDELYGAFDLRACSNLASFYSYTNLLQSVDLSGCSELSQVELGNTNGASLNVSGCIGLVSMYCSSNQSLIIDASGCTNLSYLYCSNNQNITIDVSGCTGDIVTMQFGNCPGLNVQNLSDCSGLRQLILSDCNLTEFDISGLVNLNYLLLQSNLLTQLAVDEILAKLVEFGVASPPISTPTLWLNAGNALPSETGFANIDILQNYRGWWVETDANVTPTPQNVVAVQTKAGEVALAWDLVTVPDAFGIGINFVSNIDSAVSANPSDQYASRGDGVWNNIGSHGSWPDGTYDLVDAYGDASGVTVTPAGPGSYWYVLENVGSYGQPGPGGPAGTVSNGGYGVSQGTWIVTVNNIPYDKFDVAIMSGWFENISSTILFVGGNGTRESEHGTLVTVSTTGSTLTITTSNGGSLRGIQILSAVRYNVFKDNEAFTLTSDNFIIDTDVSLTSYTYEVQAITYGLVNSHMSDPAIITVAPAIPTLVGGYLASDGTVDNTLGTTDLAGSPLQYNWNRLTLDGGYLPWIALGDSGGNSLPWPDMMINAEGPSVGIAASSGSLTPTNNQKLLTGAITQDNVMDAYSIYGIAAINNNINDVWVYILSGSLSRWTIRKENGGGYPAEETWTNFSAGQRTPFGEGFVYHLSGIQFDWIEGWQGGDWGFMFETGDATLGAFQIGQINSSV